MSVVWHSGTLGAALYNPETATIDLLRDIPEDPTFQTLQSRRTRLLRKTIINEDVVEYSDAFVAVIRSASPSMIVVSHTLDDKLREVLKEFGKNSKPQHLLLLIS